MNMNEMRKLMETASILYEDSNISDIDSVRSMFDELLDGKQFTFSVKNVWWMQLGFSAQHESDELSYRIEVEFNYDQEFGYYAWNGDYETHTFDLTETADGVMFWRPDSYANHWTAYIDMFSRLSKFTTTDLLEEYQELPLDITAFKKSLGDLAKTVFDNYIDATEHSDFEEYFKQYYM